MSMNFDILKQTIIDEISETKTAHALLTKIKFWSKELKEVEDDTP